MQKKGLLTWVEIKKSALENNIRQFRKLVGNEVILCPCVKANAYGHGLVEASKIFLESGADWLAVNALYEARALRKADVEAPIYVLGYVALEDLEEAVDLNLRLVVYNRETVEKLGKIGKKVKVHLKAETGNNRQGLGGDELVNFAKFIKTFKNIEIEGLSTHFANIEDTTDHSYAEKQLREFLDLDQRLKDAGIEIKIRHCANSAATILFSETRFEMVRMGLACYGMWPSEEVKNDNLKLEPAFCWKSKIAQIKEIAAGEFVGYGCTFKTERKTKLAIVPIGYYDGYDRGVSGKAHVLVHGKKAPVRGRVCMNIIMVDVTDIPEAGLEDEVILIGGEVTAEMFAKWAETINYEVTTRVNERIPRIVV
ncbi:MAG: alanine racemase [Candidatus Gracilibacteria bacterium]